VNDRPYRPRLTTDAAVTVLRSGAGTQWDPEMVEILTSEVPSIQRLGAA
jgi:response regulator RpfG family c-di-GMP phosphodiesterase